MTGDHLIGLINEHRVGEAELINTGSDLLDLLFGMRPGITLGRFKLGYRPVDDLKVIDLKDPANPTVVDSIALGTNPVAISVVGRFAYISDTTDSDVKIIDISDPTNLSLSGSVNFGDNVSAIDVGLKCGHHDGFNTVCNLICRSRDCQGRCLATAFLTQSINNGIAV